MKQFQGKKQQIGNDSKRIYLSWSLIKTVGKDVDLNTIKLALVVKLGNTL